VIEASIGVAAFSAEILAYGERAIEIRLFLIPLLWI
jgi:hypothetical protein